MIGPFSSRAVNPEVNIQRPGPETAHAWDDHPTGRLIVGLLSGRTFAFDIGRFSSAFSHSLVGLGSLTFH
jgi:hypothetical protein